MKRISTSNSRSLLITMATGIGAMAYLLLVFFPTQTSIGELREELAEKRQYVLDVDAEYANSIHIQEQIREIETLLAGIGMRDGNDVEMPGLLAAVTDSAHKAQVAVQRITPAPPEQQRFLTTQELELSVEGEFRQIFRFLQSLETWPGNVWFRQVQCEGETQNGETLTCRLNLTVFTTTTDSSD